MKFILQILIIFILIQLTTIGWRPAKRYKPNLSNEEKNSLKNLQEIVRVLAQDIGNRNFASYDNLNKAAAYISQKFKELGYDVTAIDYTLQGRIFQNIVAERPEHREGKEIVIIGAHYDTCFNPGADDNASGIAALLELARLLKDKELSFNMRFIAFVNEEPPFFMTNDMGSRVYTRQLREKGEKIKGAIILEMLGYYVHKPFSQRYLPLLGPFYPNRANFIVVVGNYPSYRFVDQIVKHFKHATDFPMESLIAPSFIPGVNYSDHWSFWKEGFPAVMVTDTAFLRSHHYHRPTDLPETLDYERMAEVVHGLKNVILKF